jgi:oligopeptide transport system substrate-binding protein
MAKARRLAPLACAALLVGCGGSSAPKPPHGGAVLRLSSLMPRTLDPAKAADLPSLNVVHELNAGLTRFSGRGVEPDLAESWEPSEHGLVWTFHLRTGIRWSSGVPITAEDFRRSWLRALAPSTHSAYARAEMQNIRGARRYRVTGSGAIGVDAVDDRTLRVTLQHPVPWLDEQVAWPVFFPVPSGGSATSGPFRLASRAKGRLVLQRSPRYWNAAAVKPKRVVLTASSTQADGILPRGTAAPGFPWIQTAQPPSGPGWRSLPTLTVELLWIATRRVENYDRSLLREAVDETAVSRVAGGDARPLFSVTPPAVPGYSVINPDRIFIQLRGTFRRRAFGLAFAPRDPTARRVAEAIRAGVEADGGQVRLVSVPTLAEDLRFAGPPPGIDLVLLGWSSEFFDAYNILDLFPCASAFNIARWCDRGYDRLMRRAVRELDDEARYRIERELVKKLTDDVPAIPLYSPREHVFLQPGVRGFGWSPIGFYELMGMTRS